VCEERFDGCVLVDALPLTAEPIVKRPRLLVRQESRKHHRAQRVIEGTGCAAFR
jgi:hypothetical protein